MKKVPPRYKHQDEALEFIKNLPYFALFMEQGTGKSKVVIDQSYKLFMEKKIDSIILISPNAVKDQWVEEQYPEHYPNDEWSGYIWDNAKTKKAKEKFLTTVTYKSFSVFSFNVEAFQWGSVGGCIEQIFRWKKPMVVIDESTRIKNGRRKGAFKRGGAKRTNQILDLFKRVTHKGILTGTPLTTSPFDLWSQFEFLKYDFFGMDFFFFQHHYGIMLSHQSPIGKRFKKVLDEREYALVKHAIKRAGRLTPQGVQEISVRLGVSAKDVLEINKMSEYSGFKNLEELKKKISRVTFFQKKEDCLDLPDKIYETLKVPMGKEQEKIYKTLKKEMYAEYGGQELTVTSKLVMATRLQMISGGVFPFGKTEILINEEGEEYFETGFDTRQIQDGAKVPALLEDIEDQNPNTSIIVWAKFRGEIEMIVRELTKKGHKAEKYYGGSDASVIPSFKNGEFRILVASQMKGGEGLNLQIATIQYHYSNPFTPNIRLQAEDRSHRIGQKNNVLYKDIICKNTVDEKIFKILKARESLLNYFRSNGVEDFLI